MHGTGCLVTPATVGIDVNSRMSGKFIGAAESLGAPLVCAGMGLFSGMSPDVSSLMLQSVECLFAHGTLVGPGQVLRLCRLRFLGRCCHWPHHAQLWHISSLKFPFVK